MKRFPVILFILVTLFAFGQDRSVKIAAAANLTYVLEVLKADFMKDNPGIKVETTYGASGKFATQIKEGAPFDIFMSADMSFPEKLAKDGLTATDPKIYAKGKLIMFTTKKYDLKKGLKLLKDKNIKTISIANPDTAPYGAASIEAFTNAKILKDIESKFTKAESISQVIQQVTAAADIGFTAKSLVFAKEMEQFKENVNWVEVDPKLYKKIDQGFVILKNGKDNPDVKAFYDYILSDKAKPIFVKFSYEF
jgi:molybdate transport system substrate-binding protein